MQTTPLGHLVGKAEFGMRLASFFHQFQCLKQNRQSQAASFIRKLLV